MSGERRDHPEQEISIKRREHELFVDESLASTDPVKPFSEYLRDTPPTPLSGGVKAALWAIALITALLFAASLWRLINHRPSGQPTRQRSKAKSSSRVSPRKAATPPAATPTVAVRIPIPPSQEFRR